MARTTINTQVIPDGTIVSADLTFPLTDFSSTGIDDNATSNALTIDSSQDVTFTSDAKFPDNGKAIFGAGSDLQIYHDGVTDDSVIVEGGAGNLVVQGDSLRLTNTSGVRYLQGNSGAEVNLWHAGSKKLETTSTGIDVTGDVNSDSVTTGTFTSTGIDDNATSTAITIDSSENVGIGTDTIANAKLEIASGANQIQVNTGDEATNGRLAIGHFANGTFIGTYAGTNAGANLLRFGTSGTERMRIDSSGNLLVGGTTNDTPGLGDTDVGASFRADGASFVSRTLSDTSGSTFYVNRNTNDGNLIQFQKDGAIVGSIGVSNSEIYLSSGNTGLYFDDVNNHIRPTNGSGAARDNTVDLGSSSNRFKDLHLSGTAYAGNVGVNTTSAPTPLTVAANSGAGAVALNGRSSDNIATLSFYASNGTTSQGYVQGRSDSLRVWAASGDSLSLGANDSEKMTIDLGGRQVISHNQYSYASVNYFLKSSTGTGNVYMGNVNGLFSLSNNGYYYGASLRQLDTGKTSLGEFQIATNGAFYFNRISGATAGSLASTTTSVTITDAGRLGIGTTGPATNLHIIDSNPVVRLQSSGAGTDNTLSFLSRNISNVGAYADIIAEGAGHNSTNAPIVFTQGSGQTERMRMDSSGNVAIGVSSVSPVISSSKTLQINSSGNTTLSVRAIDSVNDRSAILELLSSGNGVSKSIILYGDTDTTPSTASPLVIQKYHSGVRSEVGRFNTSGHLVLGDSTTAYYRLKSGATGTDGGMQWMFNSDATVYASLTLPYDTRATTGLHLYSGYPITYRVPSNLAHKFVAGSSEVARIDAGGIKFNGDTAAANGLDDYEEGTWTPVFGKMNSNPSVTYSAQTGAYVKIGNMVYATFDCNASSISGGVGNARISGLPYTVSDSNNTFAGYSVAQWRDANAIASYSGATLKGFAQRNSTYIYIQYDNSGSSGFGTISTTVGYNSSGRITGYIMYNAA